MSTVRIQLRRGTATEWTNADTALNSSGGLVLAAGEMGVETNTRKIKIGDGSTRWSSLAYVAADSPAISEIAQDAINDALSMGSGLTKSYNDNGNTISISIDEAVVATRSYVDDSITGLGNTVADDYVLLADVGNAGGPAKLDADGNLLIPKSSIILEGTTNNNYETTLTVTDPTADRTITFPNNSGTVALVEEIEELSQDAVNSAISAGFGITKSYNDNTNTIELVVDTSEVATVEALNSVVSSLNVHAAVDAATTGNLTASYTAGSADNANGYGIGAKLTMNATGVLTIDGINVALNDRVLVKNQTSPIHNGIYDVTTAGAVGVAAVLTRSPDYDNSDVQTPADVAKGDVVFVKSGTANGAKQFSQIYYGTNTDESVKIGIENIGFTQFSGAATIIAGNGITKSGDTLSVDDQVFLSVDDAANTYLTQANAGNIYLDKTDAESIYLTQTDATSTYLTQTDATADYLTKSDATSTYLTQTDAATDYFAVNTDQIEDANIKTGAAIAANKISGTAVTQTDTGTVTNTMLAGSIANNKLSNSTISGKALGENLETLTIGTGLTGTSYNGGSAVTIAVDSTIATESYADGVAGDAEDAAKLYADGLASNYEAAGAVSTHSSDTTNVHGITDTAQIALLDAATQQFTGDMGITGDLVVDGDVTVNGGSFVASATSIVIEDNLVQIAHQNAANTVDLGLVVGYNDGTAKHAGIVRDVSANEWKLFKGVTTEPSTTVDFTQGSLDDLELNNLTAAGIIFTDGTQTKEGVPSRTPIISKTENYTLTNLSERDSLIEVDSTSPVTITIPTNSAVGFPVGTTLDILGVNTGLITIQGDTGVTVNYTPGNKLRTQWSSCTLFKRATNSWVIYGDLKA